MTHAADPPPLRRKPSRAETARANGALSRGPATDEGRRRSSMNALAHGLRARRHLALPALGEDPDEALAHFAAVRAELGAAGPVARHLAETAAAAMLRSARADRLEGELLAGLAAGGRSLAAALHADRDARAALALFQRYRREAEGELRRALDTLARLHRARVDGLVPDGEDAAAAQAGLDEALGGLPEPSEPRIEKIVPAQRLAKPANDDRAAPAVVPVPARRPAAPQPSPAPSPSGDALLRQYRWFRTEGERTRMWGRITQAQRAAALAAAGAGHLDPEAPYEDLRPLLAG